MGAIPHAVGIVGRDVGGEVDGLAAADGLLHGLLHGLHGDVVPFKGLHAHALLLVAAVEGMGRIVGQHHVVQVAFVQPQVILGIGLGGVELAVHLELPGGLAHGGVQQALGLAGVRVEHLLALGVGLGAALDLPEGALGLDDEDLKLVEEDP